VGSDGVELDAEVFDLFDEGLVGADLVPVEPFVLKGPKGGAQSLRPL